MPNFHDAGGIESLHKTVVPNDVREPDVIYCRVRKREEANQFETVRVWRLSPLGIELVQPDSPMRKWIVGDRLELQIVIEGRRSEFSGLVVSETQDASKLNLFGVRFLSTNKIQRVTGNDDRRAMRWVCSEEMLPGAVAPSPGRFNEFVGFKIRNISNNGLLLVTSTKNSFLVPKMGLTLSVNLPMVGEAVVRCELVWMRIGTDGAEDILEIGAKMVDLDDATKSSLGQYLAQFSEDVSIPSLIEHGFIPNNVSNGIEFYALKTEDDYDCLLAMRKKFSSREDLPIEKFVHENDRVSRIIVGKVANSIVIAASVRYPLLQGTLMCEQYLNWKDSLPRADELIEIDGIVIDCPVRLENETLLALFRYICTCCTTTTRQNVLIYIDKEPRFFEDIGWVTLLHDGSQSTLIGSAYDAIKGRRTNPIKWNYVWRESAQHLIRSGVLTPAGTDKLILKIYFALGSLSKLLFRSQRMRCRMK